VITLTRFPFDFKFAKKGRRPYITGKEVCT
jgi:hypothetical protein